MIVIHWTNWTFLQRKNKEHFLSFKKNNYNSKFWQHIIENDHSFGKIEHIMKIVYDGKKKRATSRYSGNILYLQRENKSKSISDKHTVTYNKIFDTLLQTGHFTNAYPSHSPPSLRDVTAVSCKQQNIKNVSVPQIRFENSANP
jgi:hypothetical protein